MLKFGNKEFRNLQEQVEKNMKDILFILQKEGVLNEFGIKVVGQEESADNMPTVEDYKESNPDWAYGNAYAIGTEAPYTLYILTRANGTHQNDYWFNIGSFPVAGPTGPRGPRGEVGPQGQTGNPGTNGLDAGFGTINATAETVSPTDPATVTITTSGPNTAKNISFAFDIPQGEKGKDGASEWGEIGGSLENQTDLINALQAKQNASNAVTTDGTQTISSDKTIAYGNKTSYTLNNGNTFDLSGNQYNYLQIGYNGVGMYSFGTSQFFPNSNDSRDLGTSSLKWRDLYLSGTAYTNNVKTNGTYLALQGVDGALTLGGKAAQFNVPIVPTGTAQSIGASERLWKDLYLSGNLTDGTNSISVANIASKDNLNFLSLDGGTMKGNIATGGFASPEEAVLGNGLDVSDLSSPSEPVTHYGGGYIRQDDDEDSSIKYTYHFPKKSGTFALDDILNLEKRTENFESFFTKTIMEGGKFNFDLVKTIPNGLYIYTPDSSRINDFNFSHQITMIVLGNYLYSVRETLLDYIVPYPSAPSDTIGFGFLNTQAEHEYHIYVIGSIIYIDDYWEI